MNILCQQRNYGLFTSFYLKETWNLLLPAWQSLQKSRRHLNVSSGGYYHFIPVSAAGRNMCFIILWPYTSSQENPKQGQFPHPACTLCRCKKVFFPQNLICGFCVWMKCLFLWWWLCKKTSAEVFPQRLKGGITTTTTTCQGICKASWGSWLVWRQARIRRS